MPGVVPVPGRHRVSISIEFIDTELRRVSRQMEQAEEALDFKSVAILVTILDRLLDKRNELVADEHAL